MALGYILEQIGTSAVQTRHDDIQGNVATAPSGASQWLTAQIGATGFFVNWLRNGQNDFFQITLQMPHRKVLGSALDSVHVHYLLSSAPSNGQTVKLDYAWTWLKDGDAVPVIGSWTSGTKTITFAGTETINTLAVTSIVTGLTAPASETYSSILLFKCQRTSSGGGADTYGGNFGLLYCDGHVVVNRMGSVQELTD